MLYEHRKHDGSLPIVGVNTFRRAESGDGTPDHVELARATDSEKADAAQPGRGVPAHPRRRGRGGDRPAQGRRDLRRERLRRPHGRRPGLLAGPGHRGVLRGRRPVPPQRLSAERAEPATPGPVSEEVEERRLARSLRRASDASRDLSADRANPATRLGPRAPGSLSRERAPASDRDEGPSVGSSVGGPFVALAGARCSGIRVALALLRDPQVRSAIRGGLALRSMTRRPRTPPASSRAWVSEARAAGRRRRPAA